MSKTRNFEFYAEIVIVTATSLVAAHSWVRLLQNSMDRNFPNSWKADLLVALIITAIIIAILWLGFADAKGEPYVDEETQKPKHTHPIAV